jgi:CubicO group peptidase (beta-lactamase class C family)
MAMVDFADAIALAGAYHQRGGQPGLAYGIVIDGELVYAAGLGERRLGGPPPDARTVFRIASMTKSFTASAILALRDEGALRLDDLAEEYVPELRGWPPVTLDSARVSVRHLLTMTAGFPTDDPWGDRQQGLPLAEFASFLAGGVSFNWAPGTRFEYSNLGYAILGRVITAITGAAYHDHIRDRLLRPLGMTATGYEAAEFDAEDLALGYRRAPAASADPAGQHGDWLPLPFEPCGAFAPMGGVFSCVQDLARWVAGFAAAFPPGDHKHNEYHGAPHPLGRATRREMQLPQVLTGWTDHAAFPGDEAAGPSGYGFGLFVQEQPGLGRVVSHSGGYPGFGSNMRWHPASQTGVITLGNSTYAPTRELTAGLLAAAVAARQAPVYGVALAPADRGPWPETLAAREAVNRLLSTWDDAEAARLFSANVAQDIPHEERRRVIALTADRIGAFHVDPARPPEFDTPAHCRWWLAGEHATVQVQIRLSPERPPRVQSLTLAVPPAAGSPLRAALDALVAWLNGADPSLPPTIPVAGTVDAALLARRLKAAASWAGRCQAGAYTAGNGATSLEVELPGEHATLTLALAIDPRSRALHLADVTL